MSIPAPISAGNTEMVNLEDAIRKDLKSIERQISDTGKSLEKTLKCLFGLD